MVTLALREDDAMLWLRVMVRNEQELSPLDPDSPSARIKAALQCALAVCDCATGSGLSESRCMSVPTD